ncbi:MAG: hypothetical protein WCQ63_03900 [Methanomethylophilus sp.]
MLGTVYAAATLLLAVSVMLFAARADWRTREVSDRYWDVLVLGGTVLFVVFALTTAGPRWDLMLGAAAALTAWTAVRLDSNQFSALTALAAAALTTTVLIWGPRDRLSLAIATVPIMTLVYVFFYILGMLRGGADAKGLIALSAAVPLYPVLGVCPLFPVPAALAEVFVFSLSVLFMAALGTLLAMPYCLWRNRHGPDWGLRRLSGWRMPLTVAEKAFVWPAEDVRDGQIVYVRECADEEMPAVYGRLRYAGATDVFVMPMVPFLVPIAGAVLFVAVIGSPFTLFGLLL